MKRKHTETLNSLASLSDQVRSIQGALEEEKMNNHILASQLADNESEKEAILSQYNKLKKNLASKSASETYMEKRTNNFKVELLRHRNHVLESKTVSQVRNFPIAPRELRHQCRSTQMARKLVQRVFRCSTHIL